MIDQLKSLAVFVYVVQAGSFRGAATRLDLSPSVISHHIGLLEKKLGVVLFHRSTRAVSLTDDGKHLHKAAVRMVAEAENSLSLYSKSADNPLIELRIAMPSMLNGHPVFQRIIGFIKNNPGIKINLMSSDVPLHLINENVDVAIRVGRLKNSDFKARKIGQDELVVVATPGLVKRYEKLTHPNQLSSWDFISFSSVPNMFTFREGRSTVEVWGNTVATTDSIESRLQLCLAGIGVARLPYETAKADIDRKKLVELLPNWRGQTLDFYAVWTRNAVQKKYTRQFIDALIPPK